MCDFTCNSKTHFWQFLFSLSSLIQWILRFHSWISYCDLTKKNRQNLFSRILVLKQFSQFFSSNQNCKQAKQCQTAVFSRFFSPKFQGGFAKCYELRHMTTNDVWAGKIVPKSLLVKQHQREKMAQEITLHKTLSHKYVVKLNSFFEDSNFVYIILELCRRRSLMELHKRRKAVTEPETRYFMNQILLGVRYLHNQKIIHRDLKLGNIFLNDEMEVNYYKKNRQIDLV